MIDKVKKRVDALLADKRHMEASDLGWFKINLDEHPNSELPNPDILYVAHDTFVILHALDSISENETDE